ncbi:MAG: protein-glutamate O-methyltransferase CheR [Oscillospiraceae bacterium]|nr:protein-glutamate O-methyltransferase CheR [Oscillospiraceae bacterium]MDY3791834.1 protein-glutamate O-methyltransferase CheR [Oscillospiraceae bacterium]MDY6208207.1 protein-glutamate O-methyltransferase CheR [Oscillospiraceae bacterium]
MLKLTDNDFLRLVEFIKTNYGINLEKKRVLIEGRLTGIVSSSGFDNFTDYINYALSDSSGKETIRLVNKLTTNHTFFMREPEHFKFLESTVLPYIESSVRDKDARIWCAASSTGQEPYTIAMTIDEYFGGRKSGWDTTILATDLDTDVLRTAKAGVYSKDMLEGLPSKWVDKYFQRIDSENYQVIERIRNEVVFKKFNLMDPIVCKKPFDLISCRNVMIYFDAETKNALIERFYDVTKKGGYLFIGHAENVSRDTRYSYIKPAIYRREK